MGKTLDLGRRVELMPMDLHCKDITLGLYQQSEGGEGYTYSVHTYSADPLAQHRVRFITRAMSVLGGLETVHGIPGALQFSCGAEHLKACRRIFLDACKLPTDSELKVQPLRIEDKKSGQEVCATYTGSGAYRFSAENGEAQATRVPVYVNGLMKLGELLMDPEQPDVVRFPCHAAHDALVGQLMIRAQNVRAILREQEQLASRGVLSAPSAQQEV